MKEGRDIRLLITDFDGTLVDTEEANYHAYRKALQDFGVNLPRETYHACFGLRFPEFMNRIGIRDEEIRACVKTRKAAYYPEFFSLLRLNKPLMAFVEAFHREGRYTSIATTAAQRNLLNVLEYLGISREFDYWVTGEDIQQPKPHPECYLKVMSHYNMPAENALIFEDSPVGVQAAIESGANYILIDKSFYGY